MIVVGGGIAGVSAAAEISARRSVILLEAENALGYHATGRSAAAFIASYGNPNIRIISRMAWPFFCSPPADFTEVPLIRERPCMVVGREDQRDGLDRTAAEAPDLKRLTAREALARVPALRPDYVAGALEDCNAADIDVDALLQAYHRLFRARGGQTVHGAMVQTLSQTGNGWKVETPLGIFHGDVVVNAAGAWADSVAVKAGVSPIGLSPLRRTAVLVDPAPAADIRNWPLVIDVDEKFYFKPDAGNLLISPADENPSAPCDAQPEEYDIALAMHQLETTTTIPARRVKHRWAGLRTFSPDRSPVLGFDQKVRNFFWLAGQGGYGVQTAPSLSKWAACLLSGGALLDVGVMPEIENALSPVRFAKAEQV